MSTGMARITFTKVSIGFSIIFTQIDNIDTGQWHELYIHNIGTTKISFYKFSDYGKTKSLIFEI
jgi:hypothetical protein